METSSQELIRQTQQPPMLSDVKPLPTLPQICKAGELQGAAFARQVLAFTPIRALDPIEARGGIGTIIAQHAALIGFKGEIDPINKSDISGMILSLFSSLSLEELYKSLQMERYGDFGVRTEHYQLINAPYVCEILKKYKEWLRNTRQANNLPMSLPAPKEELSEEEKEARFRESVQHFYNDFKQTGQLPLFNCWIYDGLKQRGMITDFTAAEKELLTKRYRERKIQERDNKSLVSRLKQSFESVDDDISLKKEIALEYIFENDKLLIENDK